MYPINRVVLDFKGKQTLIIIEKTVVDPIHGNRQEEDTLQLGAPRPGPETFANVDALVQEVKDFLTVALNARQVIAEAPASVPTVTLDVTDPAPTGPVLA